MKKKGERRKQELSKKIFSYSERIECKKKSDVEYEFLGYKGYEAVLLTEKMEQGSYLLSFQFGKESKKSEARIGIYNHNPYFNKPKGKIYCLGSNPGSYAMRMSDGAILENGQILDSPYLTNRSIVRRKESVGEDTVYAFLQILDPKKPNLIKKYSDRIGHEELLYNPLSSISFFSKDRGFLGSVYNLKEGLYSVGVSLFNKARVAINLNPSLTEFKEIVSKNMDLKVQIDFEFINRKKLSNKFCSADGSYSILTRKYLPFNFEELELSSLEVLKLLDLEAAQDNPL